MALVDMWTKDKGQLADKHIRQVITFAGDGKLGNESDASREFRTYLRSIPSDFIAKYVDQCLQDSFEGSGFALQDLVNEIGHRLDFSVTPGLYRGVRSRPGHDGIWADGDRHKIVVEVKTTDAYRIDLNTVAGYRQSLARSGDIVLEKSSVLVVVGRQDTGDLEAQIRGSRHAWDMRVISVEALLRMLKLKEDLEDPSILLRIHEILVPREFTRLDPIVEIAFAVVEDVKQEPEAPGDVDGGSKKFTPVAFHGECISRIEKRLSVTLLKQSRASFSTPDGTVRVVCSVSRPYERGERYWFAFHPYQEEFLAAGQRPYVAFGCGSADTLFLIPFAEFRPWLSKFNRTQRSDSFYWHVKIRQSKKAYWMISRAKGKDHEITRFKI